MKQILHIIKKHRETLTYLVCGVATTAVNWVVYTLCVTVLPMGVTAANAAAWIAAVVFAFWVNKLLVFLRTDLSPAVVLREALSFLGTRLLSGAVEILLPALLIFLGLDGTILGIEGSLAKIATAVIVIVLNYVLSKLWVFA